MMLSNTLCSGIMCQLIPIRLIVLLLFSVSVLTKLRSLLPEPPVYKPCISFDTRQSDYFVFSSSGITSFYFPPRDSDLCLTLVRPLFDSCLTSVQLLFDLCLTPASDDRPEIVGHTAYCTSGHNT